ncbi:MAG TPA: hypothetical protein PLZ51_09495, partial [Aggregatilineales bacterium]|nr:hypothetical protein [Aggregatilineales bacterium]
PANLYELELLAESPDEYAVSPITDWLTERIDPIGLEFGVQSSWIIEPISGTFDVDNAYYRAFSPNSVPTTFFIYVTDSIDYVAM